MKQQSKNGRRAWSDSDYSARGYGRLGLRLPVATIAQLGELAVASGLSRAEELTEIIAGEHARWKRKDVKERAELTTSRRVQRKGRVL